MSSVIVFLRAAVMLACLVAVPLVAITQAGAVARARQTASRILDRLVNGTSRQPTSEFEPTRAEGRHTFARTNRPTRANEVRVGPSTRTRPKPQDFDEHDAAPKYEPVPLAPLVREAASPIVRPVSDDREAGDSQLDEITRWRESASLLRSLGAVEYKLEKWGSSGKLYRFECLVAIQGARMYRKHFQAVDEDGGRAVGSVLEQVRAWRARALAED